MKPVTLAIRPFSSLLLTVVLVLCGAATPALAQQGHRPFNIGCPVLYSNNVLSDLDDYRKALPEKIQPYWQVSLPQAHTGPILLVTLHKTGQLIEARLLTSSNDAQIDSLAIQAVQQAAPFPPLPISDTQNRWQFVITDDSFLKDRPKASPKDLKKIDTWMRKRLQNPLYKRWHQLTQYKLNPSKSYRGTVRVYVETSTGRLLQWAWIQKSCNPVMDNALEQMFTSITHVKPAPKSLSTQVQLVELDFDWKSHL